MSDAFPVLACVSPFARVCRCSFGIVHARSSTSLGRLNTLKEINRCWRPCACASLTREWWARQSDTHSAHWLFRGMLVHPSHMNNKQLFAE